MSRLYVFVSAIAYSIWLTEPIHRQKVQDGLESSNQIEFQGIDRGDVQHQDCCRTHNRTVLESSILLCFIQ
ncbi:MAG TPA: hypothetical protein V6D34_08985 [Candidatus Sericytochromatia bacterium]